MGHLERNQSVSAGAKRTDVVKGGPSGGGGPGRRASYFVDESRTGGGSMMTRSPRIGQAQVPIAFVIFCTCGADAEGLTHQNSGFQVRPRRASEGVVILDSTGRAVLSTHRSWLAADRSINNAGSYLVVQESGEWSLLRPFEFSATVSRQERLWPWFSGASQRLNWTCDPSCIVHYITWGFPKEIRAALTQFVCSS